MIIILTTYRPQTDITNKKPSLTNGPRRTTYIIPSSNTEGYNNYLDISTSHFILKSTRIVIDIFNLEAPSYANLTSL